MTTKEEELHGEDEDEELVELSASEIAEYVSPSRTHLDEKEKLFEQLFKHVYINVISEGPQVDALNQLVDVLEGDLTEEGIFEEELINRAERMASCFMNEGVFGEIPMLPPRKEIGAAVVTAKPDLEDENEYKEIRTSPIDEYTRTKAKVIHLISDKSVGVYGLNEEDTNHFEIEAEGVTDSDLNLSKVIQKMLDDDVSS